MLKKELARFKTNITANDIIQMAKDAEEMAKVYLEEQGAYIPDGWKATDVLEIYQNDYEEQLMRETMEHKQKCYYSHAVCF